MKSQVTWKNDDFIYYNGSVTNDQNQNANQNFILAKFFDQRTQQILDKADDYLMSVVRWSIPTSTIPLAILEPLSFLPVPPFTSVNTDPNLLAYAVGLSWFDGTNYVDFCSFLKYIPQNANINGRATTTMPQTLQNESYWYIYSYQHFLDMVNAAFLDCFTRLKLHFGAAPGTLPPKILYDPVTNLYTLYVEDAYQAQSLNGGPPGNPMPDERTNPNPNIRFGSRSAITVWLGLNLWDSNFIPGWNIDFAGINNLSSPDPDTGEVFSKAIRVIVENNTGLPNTGFTSLKTEFPVISNTLAFANLILTSDTLPVNYESINPTQAFQSSATNRSLQIVSDFTYDIYSSTQAISGRLGIIYTPSVYRFTNLVSADPLIRVSLQAQFVDNLNVVHPIYLRSNSSFNFKLMFVKKNKIKDLIAQGMKVDLF